MAVAPAMPLYVCQVHPTAAAAVTFWVLAAITASAVLTYGIRRDQERPARAVLVVALTCSLALLAATAVFGWVAYQQQRAEADACQPRTDC